MRKYACKYELKIAIYVKYVRIYAFISIYALVNIFKIYNNRVLLAILVVNAFYGK